MPTYEYSCAKCDHHFELGQPMSATAITTCPKELCGMKKWGQGKVKRAISGGAGLLFKGTGFYITDYRSENYKASAKKDSAGGGGESSAGAKKEGASGGGESSGGAKKEASSSSSNSGTSSSSSSSGSAASSKKAEAKPAKPASPKS